MSISPIFPTPNLLKSSALLSWRIPSLSDIQAEHCRRDPLYWAQHHTFTENPKWQEQGLEFRAHFPQKSYFRPLFEALKTYPRLFIPKSREMMTSWCVMLQLSVLVLQLLQLLGFTAVHPTVLRLPAVVRLLSDSVLSA